MLRTRTLVTVIAVGLLAGLLAPSPRAAAAPRKCLDSIHDPPPAIVAPPLVDDADAPNWSALLGWFGPGVFGGLNTMFPPPTLDLAVLAPADEQAGEPPRAPVRLMAGIRESAALASGPPHAANWFSGGRDAPSMLVIPEPGMSVLILAGSVLVFARRGNARPLRAARRGV